MNSAVPFIAPKNLLGREGGDASVDSERPVLAPDVFPGVALGLDMLEA